MSRVVCAVLLLLFLAISLFGAEVATAAQNHPNGKYCGAYLGTMVVGSVDIHDQRQSFDLSVRAFGKGFTCNGIRYELKGKGDHIIVKDARNPRSCLGNMLQSNGLSLDVTYDLGADSVALDLGIASIQLKRC